MAMKLLGEWGWTSRWDGPGSGWGWVEAAGPRYANMQAQAEAEGWGKACARGGPTGITQARGGSGAHAKLSAPQGGAEAQALAQAQVRERALVVAQAVVQSRVHRDGLQDARS